MELWQLDAFSYTLSTGQKITIYQIVDDATRYDVGTMATTRPENGSDAFSCLYRAFRTHGVPQQLLTDNSTAFNLSRRGSVTLMHRYAASAGCECITGRAYHPQTQGKTERAHQTLLRFLDAHHPCSITEVTTLIDTQYRRFYNDQRRHQALGGMTPLQAWTSSEHRPSSGEPISAQRVEEQLAQYRDTSNDGDAQTLEEQIRDDPNMIWVAKRKRARQRVDGYWLSLPGRLCGKGYYVLHTQDEYAWFDPDDGELVLQVPLPIKVPGIPVGAVVPLWKVTGLWLRDEPMWMGQRRRKWQQQQQGDD